MDEKYYLTDCSHVVDKNSNRVFSNIKDYNVKYVINYTKYLKGGVLGNNMNDNFNQSSRLFSSMGIVPILTASNTANNCKIVVEEEKITPKETWRLTGFSDHDFYRLKRSLRSINYINKQEIQWLLMLFIIF